MIVRVLGCSGSIAAGCKTTSFLLDDDVLIDAGTGVGDLTLEAMGRIDHILLSHSHLDHILSIPLLADSVMRLRRDAGKPPIEIHALAETILALRTHVFNGTIWPDFTRLPSAQHPVLVLMPFQVGEVVEIGTKKIEVLSAVHTVPAVGFAVDGGEAGWWVYTGDTGPNPDLWQRLAKKKISHLVIETAFSEAESNIATISRHLSPAALAVELAQLNGHVQVHITHIKPGETPSVMAEIAALDTRHSLHGLSSGDVMQISTSNSASGSTSTDARAALAVD